MIQSSGGGSSETRFLPLAGWHAFSPCFGKQFLSHIRGSRPSIDLFHSEESERVSELKNVSGSSKLPYGTLALGAEGIKDAIKGFDDACVLASYPLQPSLILMPLDVNLILKTSDCHLI